MNRTEILKAIREGDFDEKSNICNRIFTIYFNAKHDWNVAQHFIGKRCYRRFTFGQMETDERGFGKFLLQQSSITKLLKMMYLSSLKLEQLVLP